MTSPISPPGGRPEKPPELLWTGATKRSLGCAPDRDGARTQTTRGPRDRNSSLGNWPESCASSAADTRSLSTRTACSTRCCCSARARQLDLVDDGSCARRNNQALRIRSGRATPASSPPTTRWNRASVATICAPDALALVQAIDAKLRLHRQRRRAPHLTLLQARLVAGAAADADVHLPLQRPAPLAMAASIPEFRTGTWSRFRARPRSSAAHTSSRLHREQRGPTGRRLRAGSAWRSRSAWTPADPSTSSSDCSALSGQHRDPRPGSSRWSSPSTSLPPRELRDRLGTDQRSSGAA